MTYKKDEDGKEVTFPVERKYKINMSKNDVVIATVTYWRKY